MAIDISDRLMWMALRLCCGTQEVRDAAPVLLALAADDLKRLQVCAASPRESNLVAYKQLIDAYSLDYCPRLPGLHRFLPERDQVDYLCIRVQIDEALKNARQTHLLMPDIYH